MNAHRMFKARCEMRENEKAQKRGKRDFASFFCYCLVRIQKEYDYDYISFQKYESNIIHNAFRAFESWTQK